jgi:hypothetical protein
MNPRTLDAFVLLGRLVGLRPIALRVPPQPNGRKRESRRRFGCGKRFAKSSKVMLGTPWRNAGCHETLSFCLRNEACSACHFRVIFDFGWRKILAYMSEDKAPAVAVVSRTSLAKKLKSRVVALWPVH